MTNPSNLSSSTPPGNRAIPHRWSLCVGCPHCDHAVDVPLDKSRESLSCPSCGNPFVPQWAANHVPCCSCRLPVPKPDVLEFQCPTCGTAIRETVLRPGDVKRCPACNRRIEVPEPPLPPDTTPPLGIELANRAADYLEAGGEIIYRHPYYCGMGLGYANGEFFYTEVTDGEFGWAEAWDGRFDYTEGVKFGNRADFVAWLSRQTDGAMSGRGTRVEGNQRVSKARLEAVLSKLVALEGGEQPTVKQGIA
jgi:predicted RNA-binding Zn-ribbon protein involved in translation (DUF1610 family)